MYCFLGAPAMLFLGHKSDVVSSTFPQHSDITLGISVCKFGLHINCVVTVNSGFYTIHDRLSFGMQAYMFKYDSTHGIAKVDVHAVDDKTLQIGSQTVKVFGSR
jgi:hypothetical protein